MIEKYFHSKGACIFDEENLDEAIELFRKAIEIEDQPHTRYHLSCAHLKKNEVNEAIIELSRAIELNPKVPEYYFERSRIFRMIGKHFNAQKDERKAIKLDDNYVRIETIKTSLQVMKDWLSGQAWLDGLQAREITDQRLREIIDNLNKDRHERREILVSTSCSLPCPSYCCHFIGETILHGVHIGSWKLHVIRKLLHEKGLPEGEYLGRMPYHGEEHLSELIPPQYMVSEKGERWVYYPLRQKRILGKVLLRDLPKGKDCQTLLWINEKSRACVFLQEKQCRIHDAGGEPGLPSCKEFLCLTGLIFVVLKHLGLVDESEIVHRNIRELNKIAIESVLILATGLIGHKSVVEHGDMIEDILKKAIEADRSGNEREMIRLMGEYDTAKDRYEMIVSDRKEDLRAAVDSLFQG